MSIKWDEMSKPVKKMKMIGKNCKWNVRFLVLFSNFQYCFHNMEDCKLSDTCNCLMNQVG